MSDRGRVVWSEGLLLTPQHFQLADSYHEQWASDLLRASSPFNYGFTSLALDPDAILNGKVALREASGILPGGTPFSIPSRETTPSARDVAAHFPAHAERILVYLALRRSRPGEPQLETGSAGNGVVTRYQLDEIETPDETTGRDKRRVQLCRPNFRILFQDEDLGAHDHLPIGEIERRDGRLAYRETFVPPCLSIRATPVLERMMTRLRDVVVSKMGELHGRRGPSGGIAGFRMDDVQSFWLLGVLGRSLPFVSHAMRAPGCHPESVYLGLSALACELMTIAELQALPAYDHDHPDATFLPLEQYILKVLMGRVVRNYHPIELQQRNPSTWEASLTHDPDITPEVELYVGFSCAIDSDMLRGLVKDHVKVTSPDRIEDYAIQQIKGVTLDPVGMMPAAYLGAPGFIYFKVRKEGSEWSYVASVRSFAIYVPQELRAKLEFVAVGCAR